MFETRRGRLACAVTLGVCVALAAESAHGQSIPGRDPAAEAEQAKAWFAEGQVALKAGRLAEACDAFEAAFQIKKHYQVAGALGTCELAQKRFAQAATHLLYALGEPRDVTPTSERARLEGLLASAEKHLAKLTIVTTEPLVDVTIGGRPVGRSPFPTRFTCFRAIWPSSPTRRGDRRRRSPSTWTRGKQRRCGLFGTRPRPQLLRRPTPQRQRLLRARRRPLRRPKLPRRWPRRRRSTAVLLFRSW
jgi:hypothetical protein